MKGKRNYFVCQTQAMSDEDGYIGDAEKKPYI
jgi:hypothetical protein